MVCNSRFFNPQFGRAFLFLVFMGIVFNATITGLEAVPNPHDLGEYVLRLYQRILSVGKSILEFEELLILRLEKNRPVDFERAAGWFLSGKRQVIQLRALAGNLEKKIPSGDPRIAKIQSLKLNIAILERSHKSNASKLLALAGDDIKSALNNVEQSFNEIPPASGSIPFPIESLDQKF